MTAIADDCARKPPLNGARRYRLPVALFALLALVACAETEIVFQAVKKIVGTEPDAAVTTGAYKVGRPYQINGTWYYPAADYNYRETGIASWYGADFHGKRTANGETYDMNVLSAAHRTLPLPSMVRVVNLRNGRSIAVRVNDRGPFARGRIIDLSRRAAQLLGFEQQGTTPVRIEIIAQESRQLAMLAQQGGATAVAGAAPPKSDSVTVTALPPPGAASSPSPEKVQFAAAAPAPRKRNGGTMALAAPRLRFEAVKPTRLFVQAGSFVRREYAERMQRKLSPVGQARITAAVVGKYRFYRVRIGPLETVEQGDRVLDNVIAYGYPDARLIAD
jgi:rare lipoprotein A